MTLKRSTTRRQFLSTSGSCAAYVLSLATAAPKLFESIMAPRRQDDIVAREQWGRLEKVEDGIWALISTPFETRDFTTVCNGGIIAGDDRVLAVESFMNPAGATWLAEQAKKLTGKWPTDVVSTHFHGDHSSGHRGYFKQQQQPKVWLTDVTRQAAEKSFAEKDPPIAKFENVELLDAKQGQALDLGNRTVKLVPRSGHTNSDVTVEVVEPQVVWCGDLFFNRMFPNYGDAIPSRLNQFASQIVKAKQTTFVPGHGPIADAESVERYQAFLKFIEEQAKLALADGLSAEQAGEKFKLSDEFSKWLVWAPDNATRAFNAWFRELSQTQK